ncbi:MAG TPA: response regulator [Nitrospira sp.]|nr:response regulator [Nitrospira sp.]
MTEKIRMVIADDDEVVRTQIHKLVEGQKNISVVADALTGRDAIALVKKHQPAILLLDINMMPGMNGLQALQRVRQDHPDTYVLIVSALTDRESVEEARELGAHGYVAKRDLAKELMPAIETIISGRSFLSRAVSQERPASTITARVNRATEKPDDGMTNGRDLDAVDKHTSARSCEQSKAARLESGLIRVLMVDDDPVVVRALREMLAKDSQIHLVGSEEDVCANMETAVELIKQHTPHIVVLDLNLRGCGRGGWRVVKRRTQQYAQVRMILCTVDTDQSAVSEAWREGIEGYVPKMRLRELMQAIHTVHSDKTYFSPSLGERVWRPSKETAKLSPREREVFYLFVRDLTTKQILDELGVGEGAVDTHKHNIRELIGHHDGWEGVANEARKEEKAREAKKTQKANNTPKYSVLVSGLMELERKLFDLYVGRWDGHCYVGGETRVENLAEVLKMPVGEVKALILEIRHKLNCHPDGWKGIARAEGDI